ncbi:GntR family transcriptional regulator [Lachnospiraceae bacterium MD335]|nr:GntR family transcriptional regulator [Lachnospiraceae bacterium MD335]
MSMNMDDEYLPLRDVVFNTLRQEILTGKLKPGERLMEIHLANKLGVSRTPIREAIRKLELEGLVIMIPRRGAEVAQISWKSLKDVLEVRSALDALAIELACERMGQDDLELLYKACERFEQATDTKDTRKIAEADVAFHDIIVMSTGNKRLIQLVNNLSEQMYRYRFEYIKDESQHDMLVQEHKEMYRCIQCKDKKAAASVVKKHIDNQEEAIIRQLQLEKGEKKQRR